MSFGESLWRGIEGFVNAPSRVTGLSRASSQSEPRGLQIERGFLLADGGRDPLAVFVRSLPETLMTGTNFPKTDALVGVIMGSRNDWETMRAAADLLEELEVPHESMVVSAHRTPARMVAYAQSAASRGLKVIIAGAGGAAHLPGMVASETNLPVIGVPVQSRALQGLDSLLSIVQMPGGIPVATMSIGKSGAKNAGILAARILALGDSELRGRLEAMVDRQTQAVLDSAEL